MIEQTIILNRLTLKDIRKKYESSSIFPNIKKFLLFEPSNISGTNKARKPFIWLSHVGTTYKLDPYAKANIISTLGFKYNVSDDIELESKTSSQRLETSVVSDDTGTVVQRMLST